MRECNQCQCLWVMKMRMTKTLLCRRRSLSGPLGAPRLVGILHLMIWKMKMNFPHRTLLYHRQLVLILGLINIRAEAPARYLFLSQSTQSRQIFHPGRVGIRAGGCPSPCTRPLEATFPQEVMLPAVAALHHDSRVEVARE